VLRISYSCWDEGGWGRRVGRMRLQAQRFFSLNLIILFLTHANSVFHPGPYCSSVLSLGTPCPLHPASTTQSPNSSLDSFHGGANTTYIAEMLTHVFHPPTPPLPSPQRPPPFYNLQTYMTLHFMQKGTKLHQCRSH